MIVEDDESVRKSLKMYLELEGFKVMEALNGKEAMDKVMTTRPDIIVTDIMMPEMDGFQFYLLLKDQPEIRDIPVIVLTAKGSTDDIRCASLMGVDEYITKPLDPENLVSKIKEILG